VKKGGTSSERQSAIGRTFPHKKLIAAGNTQARQLTEGFRIFQNMQKPTTIEPPKGRDWDTRYAPAHLGDIHSFGATV
jgi:hypothetical protein